MKGLESCGASKGHKGTIPSTLLVLFLNTEDSLPPPPNPKTEGNQADRWNIYLTRFKKASRDCHHNHIEDGQTNHN